MSEIQEESSERNFRQEAEAMKLIINILSPLSETVRRQIVNSVATFFSIPNAIASTTASSGGNSQRLPSFSEDRALTSKEFLFEKLPQTDVERVACLAYYLTHYRDIPHFKTSDITTLNTEAAQRKFSNAAVAVDNATKLGYLTQATKGQKQLSVSGEVYVQALPDRDAAKAAMDKVKPRKRPKKTRRMMPM